MNHLQRLVVMLALAAIINISIVILDQRELHNTTNESTEIEEEREQGGKRSISTSVHPSNSSIH